ncbi:MAG: DUF2235 domain-containing protein [Acidobacteria bacterium]|nr:DUF2235 domain-containing protein [Acidobacteriota bacterium]
MVKAKNIVVCSDGTGNRGGKTRGTNVWRIFNAVRFPCGLGCIPRYSTRRATRGTFCTWRCRRSRTSSTGCSSRPKHWTSSVGSRRSDRPTSRASSSTRTRRSWRVRRCESARSSGCVATALRKRATRS